MRNRQSFEVFLGKLGEERDFVGESVLEFSIVYFTKDIFLFLQWVTDSHLSVVLLVQLL